MRASVVAIGDGRIVVATVAWRIVDGIVFGCVEVGIVCIVGGLYVSLFGNVVGGECTAAGRVVVVCMVCSVDVAVVWGSMAAVVGW